MAGVKGQRSGGHNAKTTAELRLAGTLRKDRHAGVKSPEPQKGRPKSPKKLSGDALAEWNRMCDRLEAAGVLFTTDDAAIYQVAQHFAETEDLVRLRDETGASIELLEENLHGIERSDLVSCYQEITKLRALQAGYTGKIRQGRALMRTMLNDFGLTPSSRGRVRVPEAPSDADPFAEFMEGPDETVQ